MPGRLQKWGLLTFASGGALLQSGCVADQVIETILAAFSIVDIWV